MYTQKVRGFYDTYQAEAARFVAVKKTPRLWLLLVKSTGVFLFITMIVFLVSNYQFIKAQIVDFRSKKEYSSYVNDGNFDGIPDWWEDQYNLKEEGSGIAQKDPDNDGASNLLEFQFGTNPLDPDSDQDGYFDGEEILKGYNPNGRGRIDTDSDGIFDWWEDQNGLDKNDPKDAEEDPDQDGLTNKQEFIYASNPHNRDSDNDGKSDGQEVEEGLNPVGEGTLDELAKQIDPDDEDGDGLSLEQELYFGTDPKNADSDGDGFNDYREFSRGYDPLGEGMVRGELIIPAINITAPVTWSQSVEEEKLLNELEDGLIHYPGSALPGFRGNNYITGHSSYYSWSKSSFKDVLKDLDKLALGDEVIFRLTFSDEHKVDVVYQVSAVGETVTPYDRRIFQDVENYETTLVTCWPLGTNWKRMMVKAELKSPSFK